MLHANVTIYGAWSPAIGYTFDYLRPVPGVRIRCIARGGPWFMLAELELPPNERRDVALSLHVAAVTGTMSSEEIEADLFACADAIVFHVDCDPIGVERAGWARPALDAWGGELVVVQLDGTGVPDAAHIPAADVRAALQLDAYPFVETVARLGGNLQLLYRTVIARLLAERGRLGRRPRYHGATVPP